MTTSSSSSTSAQRPRVRVDLGQALRRRRVVGIGGQRAHVELHGLLLLSLLTLRFSVPRPP